MHSSGTEINGQDQTGLDGFPLVRNGFEVVSFAGSHFDLIRMHLFRGKTMYVFSNADGWMSFLGSSEPNRSVLYSD